MITPEVIVSWRAILVFEIEFSFAENSWDTVWSFSVMRIFWHSHEHQLAAATVFYWLAESFVLWPSMKTSILDFLPKTPILIGAPYASCRLSSTEYHPFLPIIPQWPWLKEQICLVIQSYPKMSNLVRIGYNNVQIKYFLIIAGLSVIFMDKWSESIINFVMMFQLLR